MLIGWLLIAGIAGLIGTITDGQANIDVTIRRRGMPNITITNWQTWAVPTDGEANITSWQMAAGVFGFASF
jgi:hypothetical protein